MKTGRLAPYILASFLIHAGVLIGAHQFLKLPAEELESAELIPVEMVVVGEESPASQPGLVPGDRIWPKKALQPKSQTTMETATDRSADDMATPIPKAGVFEPNVTISGMATTGVIAEALAGESADSKLIIPVSQKLPSQISPVVPSAPIETALLEVKMPAVLSAAKARPTPANFQTPQRVATPLPARRPAAEPGFDPLPLATARHDQPRLTLNTNPTLRDVPRAPQAELVVGKPKIVASQIVSSHVFPVYPSMPAESSQLEVKAQAVLVAARAKLAPADIQNLQRVATPLPARRPAAEHGFDPPPLATERHVEPRLTLNTNPTLRDVPRAPQAELVRGKPMIMASQISPWQLSPAEPLPLSTSSPLDVRLPAVPFEAKTTTIPTYSQSPRNIETQLASRRTREDLAAGLQPIPKEGAYEPVLMVSTLQVQGQPNGAQVYVNGMLVGETPLAWELPLGKHEVRLALPDYYDWYALVELTPEHKTFPIIFRLVPINETK